MGENEEGKENKQQGGRQTKKGGARNDKKEGKSEGHKREELDFDFSLTKIRPSGRRWNSGQIEKQKGEYIRGNQENQSKLQSLTNWGSD